MLSALDKIVIARSKNWTVLDLSGSGLVELPIELFELTSLKTLRLGRYRTPIKNHITSIPKEIGKLVDLEVLDLTDNQLTTLPDEISNLKKLKRLVLSSNRFSTLPESVCELINLEELFIGNNNFSQLPSEIQNLKKLHTLRLNSNNFKLIPEEINLLPNLQYLFLYDNPIKNVPKELIGVREDVFPIVQQWFIDRNDGESFIYEAKLILVGEAEAGKTSLSEKLRNPDYPLNPTEPMTKGITVKKWEFPYNNSQTFCANIWDFGGQDIMHATHRYFLTERSLYVLVVDVRAEKTDFYYWLNTIELFSGKSPVIIVMNEKHAYRKELPNAIIERFKDTIVGIFHVNLKDNEGLGTLSDVIKKKLMSLPHIGQEKMLNKWLAIRNALQLHDKDFITFNDYVKITKRYGVNDEQQAWRIAKILHELGVILHFQNDSILRNTIILNKSWATEAVYLVLLDKKVTKNLGKVTIDDLDRIWVDYPTDKRPDLILLMINFLLCYEVEKNRSYIIPQLLPENPANIDYTLYFTENILYFRFNYSNFIPKGIISQLIVKMNKYIYENLQWKTGVILQIDDAFAEVTEDFFNKRIKIRVSGRDKRNALTIIRKEINEINENFERLETIEEIPCGCFFNQEEEKPFYMKRSVLEKYKINNEKTIKCDICLKVLSVLQLLDATIGDEDYIEELQANIKPNIVDKVELVKQIIGGGEMRDVEFKSTLFVPLGSREYIKQLDNINKLIDKFKYEGNESALRAMENKLRELEIEKDNDKAVKHSTMKNIVAFANTDGGYIVIGVSDNKEILGLQNDFNRNSKTDKLDEFNKDFDMLLNEYIGNHMHSYIKPEFVQIDNQYIFLITILKSDQPILLLKGEKGEVVSDLYVRGAGSARKLNTAEVIHFINSKNTR